MATASSQSYYNEVQSIFIELFDRPAGVPGYDYFGSELATGANPVTVFNQIAGSPEVSSSLTVTDLFENLLGRAPAAAGLSFFNGELAFGMTIAQVASQIYFDVLNEPHTSQDYMVMTDKIDYANNYTDYLIANSGVAYNTPNASAYINLVTPAGVMAGTIPTPPTSASMPSVATFIAGTPVLPSSSTVSSVVSISAVQTNYSEPSAAGAITFVANDSGSSVIVNGVSVSNGSTPPGSVLSSADSLSAAAGNSALDIFAYPTTAGSQTSGTYGADYATLLPSSMKGINTIYIDNNSNSLNTGSGAAASVSNIIVNNAVSDDSGNTASTNYFTDIYTITPSQNLTYENSTWGAVIDSTGTSANVTLDDVVLPASASINGVTTGENININGSSTATLNLTSAGTNVVSITNDAVGSLSAAPLTSLVIDGAASNSLSVNDGVASNGTVNATGDAGTLNFTLSSPSNVAIETGTGADIVNISGTATGTDKIITNTVNAAINITGTGGHNITVTGTGTGTVDTISDSNTGTGSDFLYDNTGLNDIITLEGTGAVTVYTSGATDTIYDDSSNTAPGDIAVYTIFGSDAITLGGSNNQVITVDNADSGKDSITDSGNSNTMILEGTGAVTVNTDTSGTDTIYDYSSNTAPGGITVNTIFGSDAITLGGSNNQAITVDNNSTGIDIIADGNTSNSATVNTDGTGTVDINLAVSSTASQSITVDNNNTGIDNITDDNTYSGGVTLNTAGSGVVNTTLTGSNNQSITVDNTGSGTDSITDSANSNAITLEGTGAVTVNTDTSGTDTISDDSSYTTSGGITVNTTSSGSDAITLGGSTKQAITVDNTGSGTDSITDKTTGSHADTITLIGAGSDIISTNSTGGHDNITTTSSTATAITISNDTIYSKGTPSSSTLGLLPAITNTHVTTNSSTAYSNVSLTFSADNTAHALSGTASTITVDKFDTNLYSFTSSPTNLQTAISDVITALQTVDTSTTAAGNYDAAAYFQYSGNTYIVNDYNHETSTTSTYTDQVVQLTGTANLSTTTVGSTTSVIHVG